MGIRTSPQGRCGEVEPRHPSRPAGGSAAGTPTLRNYAASQSGRGPATPRCSTPPRADSAAAQTAPVATESAPIEERTSS